MKEKPVFFTCSLVSVGVDAGNKILVLLLYIVVLQYFV